MCSCNKKPAVVAPTPESFSATVEDVEGARRVFIAARAYVRLTINNRLYTLRTGQTAPMYENEANSLIEIGAPVWIESYA